MQELHTAPAIASGLSTSARNLTWLGYSPDGSLLAVSDAFDVFLLDPVTGTEVQRLDDCVGTMADFEFSPDNTLMAIAASEGLCLFSVATGDMLASLTTPDWLNGVTFSPDQTLIAAAGKDRTVRVYGLP
ncbi:MAG: hypothetical protein IPK19_24735 [Chloroflexi bacterium]|nr:hypothetical protein [Chloroflexota bacterium]